MIFTKTSSTFHRQFENARIHTGKANLSRAASTQFWFKRLGVEMELVGTNVCNGRAGAIGLLVLHQGVDQTGVGIDPYSSLATVEVTIDGLTATDNDVYGLHIVVDDDSGHVFQHHARTQRVERGVCG